MCVCVCVCGWESEYTVFRNRNIGLTLNSGADVRMTNQNSKERDVVMAIISCLCFSSSLPF
jgi:hypothetical protein